MEFYFFFRKDPKKEPIGRIEANNMDEAISKFTFIKKLPISKFLPIFNVVKKK